MTSDCPTCKKIIVKPHGIIQAGRWYCNPECMPEIEDCLPDADYDPDLNIECPGLDMPPIDHQFDLDGEADLNFDELIN